MARYIDMDKYPDIYPAEADDVVSDAFSAGYYSCLQIIKEMQTEDVAPVVHARWKFGKCTKCGGDAPFWCMASTYRASSYCPDCGAKMDEEVDA